MCGRYVSSSAPDELARYFGAEPPEALLEPNFNVAPTTDVYAVLGRDGHRRMGTLRWGLVPFWAKDPSVGSRMINARAEGVADKPAFRRAFERRRCLLPADGFYEWQVVPGRKAKQPYFVHRADGEPVAFAALWERWSDPADADGAPLYTCCLITTDANADMARIHDRMPVLLPPSAWDRWLDPTERDVPALLQLLTPAPVGLLELRAITTAVNDVRNQGPQLLDPAPTEAGT
jgi:putative SOS response-associated peptidase YedK